MVHSIEALRQHSTALLKHSRKLREDAGEARARSAKIREAAQRAQLSTCYRLAHAEVVLRRQDRATSSTDSVASPGSLSHSTITSPYVQTHMATVTHKVYALVRERPGITSEELAGRSAPTWTGHSGGSCRSGTSGECARGGTAPIITRSLISNTAEPRDARALIVR